MQTSVSIRDFLERAVATFPNYKVVLKTGQPWDRWFVESGTECFARIVRNPTNLIIEPKFGSGFRSEVPWIGIRRRDSTLNFMRGIYIAYLFAADRSAVFLSLQQGVTRAAKSRPGEFGRPSKKDEPSLRKQADEIRAGLNIPEKFQLFEIDLHAQEPRPRAYSVGHIIGKRYSIPDLPRDAELISDLNDLVGLYEQMDGVLVSIGQTSSDDDSQQEFLSVRGDIDPDQFSGDIPTEILSAPQKLKRAIEIFKRDRAIVDQLKRLRKYTCERCNYKSTWMTDKGVPYVECHHLVPLGKDGADDVRNLIVLCADCHKRLHYSQDGLDETRRLLESRTQRK